MPVSPISISPTICQKRTNPRKGIETLRMVEQPPVGVDLSEKNESP